jgi:hypothetical protein
MGRSSFSQDWHSFQRSNAVFHAMGDRWMQRALPGDQRHEMYRTVHGGVSRGMELGTFALGGVGLAKGAYSLVQKGFTATKRFTGMQKIGRPAAIMKGSADQLISAYNRATFEAYKTLLRAQMEKPFVVDSQLKGLVDLNYRRRTRIGSGSTAAAIRHELATGERVFDKLHSQKGRDSIAALEKWLKNNPTARAGDRAAAENIIKDLQNALEK